MSTGRTTNPRKAAARDARKALTGALVEPATPDPIAALPPSLDEYPEWTWPGPGWWDPKAEVVVCCGREYRTDRGYHRHLDIEHDITVG